MTFTDDINEGVSGSFPFSAIFCDVHNLVLEDEQIGDALARQPHHIFVIVLDPPVHDLAVHELDRDRLLLFSQRLEESSLLERIFRRWRPGVLGGIGIPLSGTERHAGIVHNPLRPTAHEHSSRGAPIGSTMPEIVALPAGGAP
jgi:hypothetical protein